MYLSASDDKTVMVWDASTFKPLVRLIGHSKPVRIVKYSEDGPRRILTASDDGRAVVWDAGVVESLAEMARSNATILTVDLIRNDLLFIVNNSEWGDRDLEELAELARQTDTTLLPALLRANPDGTTGISLRDISDMKSPKWVTLGRGEIGLEKARQLGWAIRNGAKFVVLAGHAGAVLSAAFSPDGTRVVTAPEDGTARVWDAGTGKTAGHFDVSS